MSLGLQKPNGSAGQIYGSSSLHWYRREKSWWEHIDSRDYNSSLRMLYLIQPEYIGECWTLSFWANKNIITVCSDQGHAVSHISRDAYFGLCQKSFTCLGFTYAWEVDCCVIADCSLLHATVKTHFCQIHLVIVFFQSMLCTYLKNIEIQYVL